MPASTRLHRRSNDAQRSALSGTAMLMPLELHTLTIKTEAPIELLDITDDVSALVKEVGLREGLVTVFSRHTTAAIRVQEAEPLLLDDLREFLTRMAPRDAPYRHNDFEIRRQNMLPDESPNAHSHCLHMMLGTSEMVPVAAGAMQLGRWQRLLLIELDGPRPCREVLVQLIGCTASALL